MDIFAIEATVRELAEKLIGARINKIHQPGSEEILFRLWHRGEDLRLLISASPQLSRIHLTGDSFPNPFTPPRFCQLLRARLSRLTGIEQVAGERIVKFTFSGKEGASYVLMAELLGRHANLVLVDRQGQIVDAMKRVSGEGARRRLLPGLPYVLPPEPERFFLADGLPETMPTGDFEHWLMQNLSPMSPLMARDLAEGMEQGREPREVLDRFRRDWRNGEWRPAIGLLRGKEILSVLPLRYLSLENARFFPTVSEAAAAFYLPRALFSGAIGERDELVKVVRKGLKRLASRLEKIALQRVSAEDSDAQRRIGELLLANLHRLSKGANQVVLEDFFQDPPAPITIPLDPRLSPQENAEQYFKGFKKGKRGIGHLARRIEETRAEQEWLEQVALSLDEAEAPQELGAIREELETAGLIRPRKGPVGRNRAADPKQGVRRLETPMGNVVLWGKNNRTNDHVSKHVAGPEDLWFHAHQMPGCHLVLKAGFKAEDIPESEILFAASIAAGFSRGRNAGKVEVMVSQGKWVHKPKGARPGLVTVERYRTVVVRPFRPELV